MDFTRIVCGNDYPNYTVCQFIRCYDKMDVREFERMSALLSRLRDGLLFQRNARIESTRYIVSGYAVRKPDSPKEPKDISTVIEKMSDNLDRLMEEQSEMTEKETAFLLCMRKLIETFPFLSPEELYILNVLFEKVQLFDKFIAPERDIGNGILFYQQINLGFDPLYIEPEDK